MANSFLGTPPIWVIDTASATAVSSNWLHIKSIVWDCGTGASAGNECKITDVNGNVIFDAFATGADGEIFPREFPKLTAVHGLIIPTLAAGKVYIYLQ